RPTHEHLRFALGAFNPADDTLGGGYPTVVELLLERSGGAPAHERFTRQLHHAILTVQDPLPVAVFSGRPAAELDAVGKAKSSTTVGSLRAGAASEHRDLIPARHQRPCQVGADETSTPGDDDAFHAAQS